MRPELLADIREQTLFLSDYGEPFRDNKLGDRVKRYLKHAGIDAPGSCHLLRHACATHMLENGAELRFIRLCSAMPIPEPRSSIPTSPSASLPRCMR